jgi:hypothetical protein
MRFSEYNCRTESTFVMLIPVGENKADIIKNKDLQWTWKQEEFDKYVS